MILSIATENVLGLDEYSREKFEKLISTFNSHSFKNDEKNRYYRAAPPGYQTCPRCGGRGKEEHALGFKVKRCKLCGGKGFLPPPPPPPVHHHHHRRY